MKDRVIITQGQYVASAVKKDQYPEVDLPEIVFIGRSNVGKSSLINSLTRVNNLARVSSQPGKTQTINFFEVGVKIAEVEERKAFYLVDLPGYGYAKANVKVKEQWGRMIENYLHTSRQLRTVFLLLDIRHEPTGQDVMMYDWILQAGFTPVIIATKADKVKRSQIQKQIALLRRTLREESRVQASAAHGQSLRIIPWSGQTKSGREEIYAVLDSFLEDGPEPGGETAEPEQENGGQLSETGNCVQPG